MAVTLTADNSYATHEEATTYLSNLREGNTWVALAEDPASQLLITATALIDRELAPFVAQSNASDQALAFPRETFSYFDTKLGRVIEVTAGTTPQQIKDATMLQAAYLAENADDLFEPRSGGKWNSLSLDGMSLSDSTANQGTRRPPLLPMSVRELVKPFRLNLRHTSESGWWRAN